MSECVTLYATFADHAEAERIIEALLDARLIACASVLPEVTSHYHWEGKRERSKEAAAIMKTTAAKQAEAVEKIAEMHSYDCPCVTVWEIKDGYAPYLDWIRAETA